MPSHKIRRYFFIITEHSWCVMHFLAAFGRQNSYLIFMFGIILNRLTRTNTKRKCVFSSTPYYI